MPGEPAGVCFGFGVRSTVPLRFLRPRGEGGHFEVTTATDLDEERGVVIIERHLDGKPFIRVHKREDGFGVWYSGLGWFGVEPDVARVAMPPAAVGSTDEVRLWGLPAALCFIARGDLSLHAATLDVDGAAILLAAPGRYGKTTLAAGFVQAGARLLSEDLSCCRVQSQATVLPGPAFLRVRHDVFGELALPGTSAVGEDEERVLVAVDESNRGDGAPVPIRGVVFVRKHDDAPRIESVQPQRALPDLLALSVRLPDEADLARAFRAVADLVAAVPIWNVYRRLVISDLPATVDLIRRTCADV